jgi:hypothetical protein
MQTQRLIELDKLGLPQIIANNIEEFGTIFDKSGMILKVVRGDKNDKGHLFIPRETEDIIKKGTKGQYTLVH